MNEPAKGYRKLSLGEEIANSISHGIGTLLSIAGLVILVIVACRKGTVWHVVSFSIFGSTMVLLYLSSTLYHSFQYPKVKNLFARFDHVSIFLLIAGTYTPFMLTNIRGAWGWSLFGVIWGLAIGGAVIRAIYLIKFKRFMIVLYVLMGWMFVIASHQIIKHVPTTSLVFLFIGGGLYTIGVIFYLWKKLPFGHFVWHFFVLGGSINHFFSILYSIPK